MPTLPKIWLLSIIPVTYLSESLSHLGSHVLWRNSQRDLSRTKSGWATSLLEILQRLNKNKNERQCPYNGAWGPSCPYSLYIFWAPQNSFLLPLNVHFCPYIGDVPALPISSPHTVSLWGTKFLLWIILFFLIVSTLLSWEALFTFHFLKETSTKCCPCTWFPSISLL